MTPTGKDAPTARTSPQDITASAVHSFAACDDERLRTVMPASALNAARDSGEASITSSKSPPEDTHQLKPMRRLTRPLFRVEAASATHAGRAETGTRLKPTSTITTGRELTLVTSA
jgi:hypothetical protein